MRKNRGFLVGWRIAAFLLTVAFLPLPPVPAPSARADRNYVEPCFDYGGGGTGRKASSLCSGLVDLWNFEETEYRAGVFKSILLEIPGVNNATRAGKLGTNAADFDATSDHRLFQLLQVSAPYTIGAWLRADALPTGTGNKFYVVSWDSDDNRGPVVYIEKTASNAKLCFRNGNSEDDALTTVCSADGSIAIDTWYYFAVGESPYFAGKNRLFLSLNGGALVTSAPGYYTRSGLHFMVLGHRHTAISTLDTAATRFDGGLDQFAIWARALSPAEITLLYGGGSGLAYPWSTDVS